MTATDTIIDYFRAMITRDLARAQVIAAELDKIDRAEYVQGVGAVFVSAVDTQFSEEADVREITQFVKNLRDRFQDGEDIDPRLAEAAIRMALGEDGLLVGADPNKVIEIEMTIIYAMMNGYSSEELEKWLQETRELMLEED